MIDNNKTLREMEKVLNGESNFVVKSKEQFNRCMQVSEKTDIFFYNIAAT